MKQQSHTPDNIQIQPRNREHAIAECLGRDWFDNHPFKTAWFNAMSMTFPLGEKFFIDSVREYQDWIEDPKLQAEIRNFCGQEGFHRREHERYNRELCKRRGYDYDYLEARLQKNIDASKKMFSPMEQLASTAAFEHMTAIMAESALSDDSPMMGAAVEPAMRELWDWHAAEEMEHKAVAFDVYRAMGGEEKMRKKALRLATVFLALDVMVGVVHMLKHDGRLWDLKVWTDGWRFLFARGGILRRLWPAYRSYFKDGFHPWQRDTSDLLAHWQQGDAEAVSAPVLQAG